MAHDLAASVRARLLDIAKAEQTDFNSVLVRYALERFLYRLGQSAHADHFVLKGAMLFNLWYAMPHRPTRDVDLLGFGPSDLQSIAQAFREIVNVVAEDGIVFDAASVRVEEIRKNAGYAGARVIVSAQCRFWRGLNGCPATKPMLNAPSTIKRCDAHFLATQLSAIIYTCTSPSTSQ